MDVDSWLGVLLVVAAALLLVLTSAASAAGLIAARRPPQLAADRGGRVPDRAEPMQRFLHNRQRLIASLALSRIVCIAVGTSTAAALVIARTGVSGRPVLLVTVCAIAATALLESIPRVVIANNPERWNGALAPVAGAIQGFFYLPASLFNVPGMMLLRLPPLRPLPPREDDDEELVRLVELEESQGGFEDEEREMIRAVIELEDTAVREIMVPRLDIAALESHATLQDVAELIARGGYSRIPLYDGSIDNVVGVVYAKDVLAQFANGAQQVTLESIARHAEFVPETKRVDELLRELRDKRVHIAIVVDEYGGTAGLVTIEDLVEEIIGEIEDEFDHGEPSVVRTGDDDVVVDAREGVHILNDLFDVKVEDDDFDTVGGLIIDRLGKIPAPNDTIEIERLRLRVLSVNGRRIRKVRITRIHDQPGAAPEARNPAETA